MYFLERFVRWVDAPSDNFLVDAFKVLVGILFWGCTLLGFFGLVLSFVGWLAQ